MNLILAEISGQLIINFALTIIIVAVVYMLIEWALTEIPIPPRFAKIVRVAMILIALIFLIDALLALLGRGFIRW